MNVGPSVVKFLNAAMFVVRETENGWGLGGGRCGGGRCGDLGARPG